MTDLRVSQDGVQKVADGMVKRQRLRLPFYHILISHGTEEHFQV